MDRILVTGASGVLGSELCKFLKQDKIPFKTAGRKKLIDEEWVFLDLKTGKGIDSCVKDTDMIFHLASSTRSWDRDVDIRGTKWLTDAAKAAGVKHFIFISIVGTDKVDMKYYKMKAAAEDVVKKSGLNYSILRATQFHELLDKFFSQYFLLPISLFPKHLKIQPVETRVVAKKLFEIAKDASLNAIINIGGKEVLESGKMAEQWIRVRGKMKWIINLPNMGAAMNSVAAGNLTCSEVADDSITWSNWLERKYV